MRIRRPRSTDSTGTTPRRKARYELIPEAAPKVHEVTSARDVEWPRVISATQAARGFSDLISRVSYKRETYIIERGGHAMCEIRPITARGITGSELRAILKTLPRPAEEFLAAVDDLTRHQATIEPSAWEK